MSPPKRKSLFKKGAYLVLSLSNNDPLKILALTSGGGPGVKSAPRSDPFWLRRTALPLFLNFRSAHFRSGFSVPVGFQCSFFSFFFLVECENIVESGKFWKNWEKVGAPRSDLIFLLRSALQSNFKNRSALRDPLPPQVIDLNWLSRAQMQIKKSLFTLQLYRDMLAHY